MPEATHRSSRGPWGPVTSPSFAFASETALLSHTGNYCWPPIIPYLLYRAASQTDRDLVKIQGRSGLVPAQHNPSAPHLGWTKSPSFYSGTQGPTG